MKTPMKMPTTSLIKKVASEDKAFTSWAKSSGIATSAEIKALPKDRLMKLYRMYMTSQRKAAS